MPEHPELECWPELAAYATQPAQMPAAAPGKVGCLRLGFVKRQGRSVLADLYRVAPLLVQQALYWDEAMPDLPICMITSVGGGTLQGDRLSVEVRVGADALAHVTTQGAQRIQAMDANYAVQRQHLVLEAGAYLEFIPEVTIPYRHARYLCETQIEIDETATLIFADSMMAGRKHHGRGERFAYDLLSLRLEARRPDGRLIYAERMLIEPARESPDLAGVMAGLDVFGSVLVLAPPVVLERIRARSGVCCDAEAGLYSGLSPLPSGAGLLLRIVAREHAQVRQQIREFWRIAREESQGCSLPDEFAWR